MEHQRLVKDVLVVEACKDWILRAKSGWSGKIAWIEWASGPVFFALNIDTPDGSQTFPKESKSLAARIGRLMHCRQPDTDLLLYEPTDTFSNRASSASIRRPTNLKAFPGHSIRRLAASKANRDAGDKQPDVVEQGHQHRSYAAAVLAAMEPVRAFGTAKS